MEQIIERCCGLDVHKVSLAVCVRSPDGRGRRAQRIKTFSTTTIEFFACGDWLAAPARGRLRNKLPALRDALTGRFRSHLAFLVGQFLQDLRVDYFDRRHRERVTHRAIQLLERQGYRVVPQPAA